jgi:hypothetical protein
MRIVPVNFKSEHNAMLVYYKMILETDGGGSLPIQIDLTN